MNRKVIIENIKGISHMEFNLPNPGLYVVTGQNGSGKTTLFTCLSRICNNNAFRIGFPSSQGNDRLDYFAGYIEYKVDNVSVRYIKHQNGKWRPNNKQTNIFSLMGYPEVKNVTTKDERQFTQTEIIPRRNNQGDVWLNEKMNQVLGTDKFSSMIRITIGQLYRGRGQNAAESRRRNIAYAIPTSGGKYYTERNFSFGEIVLLNLLYDIHNVRNGSLVLIDELELALHPSAQVRLLSCLEDMAHEKGLTVLITTHSASIIRNKKTVILLESLENGRIDVLYDCPPAKAIGAIGMREDTMPDIVILVEDEMAKALFEAMKQKYLLLNSEYSYLDIRVLEIGGYRNVINFYAEAIDYVFYSNVFLTAFMDKDVETDIIPYPQYGNRELIEKYNSNIQFLKFLPYTPEVLLVDILTSKKRELLNCMQIHYSNQQLDYSLTEVLNFDEYNQQLPEFVNQSDYNACIEKRGQFRSKCKNIGKQAVEQLSSQINCSQQEIYRFIYQFAVEKATDQGLNVKALLAQTIKRLR